MAEWTTIQAEDGHRLDLYIARPTSPPIAGLVVLQEIFGVNAHIRSIADAFAQDGFLAVAPALFDRIEKSIQLGYEGADRDRAMACLKQMNPWNAIKDVAATLAYARQVTGKKAGVIGYCWGGLIAWLSATRLHPDAAVAYYAGGIGNFAQETPQAPVQLHFGRLDTHIPAEQVNKVGSAHPEVEIHWYENAGHAFNCDMRASYHADSAAAARLKASAFLRRHLA